MTSGKSVLVIGDVMVDEYFTGIVSRISPEASVPILDVKSITDFPGGAANVAVNVNAAGFKPVVLSVIGNDREGRVLLDLFDKYGIDKDGLIISDTRKTTVKQRFISNNRQIFRAD
ncbi:MAG: bifunctional heptose 7-phosphate kinase/heptose 1-phosphate adenyltransferase, partial [Bacteroidales bacterium]|nr:bifunctional heptose 7-phosphate kinase/heptose 1-phosphate adenyltransferase [Bacteroidales bacterium]